MFADDKKKPGTTGGLKPDSIVASEPAPTISAGPVSKMAGGTGDAIGGTAGKRINQAADLYNRAMEAKRKVQDSGREPMNFMAEGATIVAVQPSGLQFTLTAVSLPAATFVVVDFTLSECLSSPFLLNVSLGSASPDIDFSAVLDQDATLSVWRDGVLQRSVTGMVESFGQGDTGFHQTRYSMVIRPALWRTSLRRNSRIFQQESVENIITTLLKENGINDFAFGLRNPHPAREFCVQYQESDFDFIQRLTAEEGIFYYFEFSTGKNTVVYADDVGSLPQGATLPYNPNIAAQAKELCISTFTRSAQVRPATVELKDYTFKNPNWASAFSEQAGELHNQRADYEHFDFPGRFKDEQRGQDFTRYRLEALRNDASQGGGKSNDFSLQPGQLFSLTAHPRGDLNRPWQLLKITHSGKQPQALEQEAGESGTVLTSEFSFLPHTQTWRPTPLAKPAMDGPQIAMVVGPAGEEIYCDEYGRIRLQFLWDRYGNSDDGSSCWIRVTQPWAGQGWGMLAIPRIGQEVVVDFLHGDPDQPIVTGRTYHANNIPPGSLPGSKTQMAFRSKTHKGEGFNELRFEDAKGSEGLFLHAQKDMTTTVLNDRKTEVTKNHKEIIGENQSVQTGKEQSSVIGTEQKLLVKSNQIIEVNGKKSLTINGGRFTEIKPAASTVGPSLPVTDTLVVESNITIHSNTGGIQIGNSKACIIIDAEGNIKIEGETITVNGTFIGLNA